MLELLGLAARRAGQIALLYRVERDQIDVALHAAQPGGQLLRVFGRAVHAFGQRVFENDAAARFLDVIPAFAQNVFDFVRFGHRHHRPADLVVRGVQGDAERHRQPFVGEAVHARHKPARRQRHRAQRQLQPALFAQQPQEFDDVLIIVQRLAAAHEHDVGDFPLGVRRDDLAENFSGRQVAGEAFERRGAEFAAHAAADLRGNAQRVAVVIPHAHALDEVAVRQAVEVFDRSVEFGGKPLEDRHAYVVVFGGESFAQRPGQIAHPGEFCALMQPGKHLPRAERGLSHGLERLSPFKRG